MPCSHKKSKKGSQSREWTNKKLNLKLENSISNFNRHYDSFKEFNITKAFTALEMTPHNSAIVI